MGLSPNSEKNRSYVWLLLPAFPIELWTESIFVGLENSLGRFIKLDKQMFHGVDKQRVTIMVEIDISKGIPAEMDG